MSAVGMRESTPLSPYFYSTIKQEGFEIPDLLLLLPFIVHELKAAFHWLQSNFWKKDLLTLQGIWIINHVDADRRNNVPAENSYLLNIKIEMLLFAYMLINSIQYIYFCGKLPGNLVAQEKAVD